MPRKGGAAAGIKPTTKPKAPGYLTDRQRAIWDRVLDDVPVEWFSSKVQYIQIAQLARHLDRADTVANAIDEVSWLEQPELRSKLEVAERANTQATIALMRSMRLTNQSTSSKGKKLSKSSEPKPWE